MSNSNLKSYDVIFSADGVVQLPDLPQEGFAVIEALEGKIPEPKKIKSSGARTPRLAQVCQIRLPILDQTIDHVPTSELWDIHNNAMNDLPKPSGEEFGVSLLDLKVELARRMLLACEMCEFRCGVDRWNGECGHCGNGREAYYTSCFLNWAEEKHLVPSITVFLSGCNWRCPYCQYPQYLDSSTGTPLRAEETVALFKRLSEQGGRNLHWLGGNPDQHLWSVLSVMQRHSSKIPIVWNTNGYASTTTMALLHNVVDTYIIDFRYGNDQCALRYGAGSETWHTVTRNLKLAKEQGAEVIVRHLQLPHHLECCTFPVLEWLAENLPNVKVNLMNEQYYPAHLAFQYPEISKRLGLAEKEASLQKVYELGLHLVE